MPGIIKAHELEQHDAVRCIAFNFDDMTDKARRYLEEVRREAAQILGDARRQAQAEAEKVRREAAERGRREALDQVGQMLDQKVQANMQTLLPALDKAIGEIESSRHAWLRQWENNLMCLVTAIAEKVIHDELKLRPELTLETIRAALELAVGGGVIKIYLNPADHQALGPQVEALAGRLSGLGRAELIADPAVSPGGCHVLTELGEIDHRIESQLERIREELTDHV